MNRVPSETNALLGALGNRLEPGASVLVLGPSGPFKTRLMEDLGHWLEGLGHPVRLVGANPGQPSWGPPASIVLLTCDGAIEAVTFIGTLDPLRQQGRYLAGVSRLMARGPQGAVVLVDAPGVTRGYTAEELLEHLCDVVRPSLVIVAADQAEVRLAQGLLDGRPGVSVAEVGLPDAHARLSKAARKNLRTERFDQYFAGAPQIRLDRCRVVGFQPEDCDAWLGRIIGLLGTDGETLAIGEVVAAQPPEDAPQPGGLGCVLQVRVATVGRPVEPSQIRRLLVGTLYREPSGLIVTYRPSPPARTPRAPSGWTLAHRPQIPVPISWPVLAGSAAYQPRMLNSLFGDPGLMLRHYLGTRAVLFDLGWLEEQLPGKVLHGVTDIFISHTHMDHAQGLVTLLRALIGPGGQVRLYGPPGLDAHVASLLGAFRFNLLKDDGPVFTVHTLHGDQLHVHRIQCADPAMITREPDRTVKDGVLLDDPDIQVRAIEVQHSIPVLAFRAVTHCRRRADGSPHPNPRTFELAYVTDVGDDQDNLSKLIGFAQGVDLMVCEASFVEADDARAKQTRHLTTRAAAELAGAANVGRLVPFHISVRYQDNPEAVFAELMARFDRVFPALPPGAMSNQGADASAPPCARGDAHARFTAADDPGAD